ncbi:MAG: thioredoxin family protein [Cytophagaceae bacterium]|nr:thioredoxin family protein [Cytophagaceae bacterium]MBL0301303.1 thioredoxin family protein [Cytophagaceae bacterium]MBL0324120.1 thioredoxin family protein [Cytophagaceae bacterium]
MKKSFLQVIKFFVVFGMVSLSSCHSQTQKKVESVVIDKTKVTWNPSIDDALAQAKAQGKILFVECFSPTCPVCQSMEPFFKKPEVATKFNTDFINYKLDVGNAEQVKFLNARNIWLPSFPQFLFFDSEGTLVHQAEVTPDVKSFLSAAEMAQNPDKRAGNYKKRFDGGERSFDLLVQYAAFCRLTKDTLSNISAANELFKLYPKNELGTEASWKITKKCVSDIDNGFATYWFNHVPQAAAFEVKEGHAGNENNILGTIVQTSLFSAKGKQYGTAKLAMVKDYMVKSGAGQYVDGVTWELESLALIREGKAPQSLVVGDKMSRKYEGNGQAQVYITSLFNKNYPDKAYVAKAKAWMAKAKASIKDEKLMAEYYYESARLNKNAGDIPQAKADATQARNLAVKYQMDLVKYNELVSSL